QMAEHDHVRGRRRPRLHLMGQQRDAAKEAGRVHAGAVWAPESLPRRGRVAERSEAGWGLTERVVDNCQHAVQIAIDVVVPETQYAKPFRGQMMIALRVALGMRIKVMLAAVDFDDEPMLEANKINDVVFTRRLSPEVESLFSP